MKPNFTASALAVAGMVWGAGAMAASITPETVTHSMYVGDSFTIHKNITLDATGAGVVDIFFLADNTGSMGGVINNVKTAASGLLTTLASTYSSAAFGVGRYLGDPIEYGGGTAGATSAYQLQQAITASTTNTQTAINGWYASGGGDAPEANFYALQQVATQGANTPGTASKPPLGSGAVTGWRAGAKKVIVWFGDASSHQGTITQAQTIAALQANNVVVAGMNSTSAGGGINTSGQAAAITTATGGVLINSFASVPSSSTAASIISAIGSTTSILDLVFGTTYAGTGLDISFTCTDIKGCDDVLGGESRSFDVTITALAAGDYDFDVFAEGVSATEHDFITVGIRPTGIPEPAALALMGLGMAGLGFARRR